MSDKLKLLVYSAAGLILGFVASCLLGMFSAETAKDSMRLLCDGFFIVGALMLGIGGLIWTGNDGVFDGLTYSVRLLVIRVFPSYDDKKETFGEYRQRKHGKASSPKLLLLSGLIVGLTACVLYLIYSLVF